MSPGKLTGISGADRIGALRLGHANGMPLSHRKRCCRNGRLKCSLLGLIGIPDRAVMFDVPGAVPADDVVSCKSHVLPLQSTVRRRLGRLCTAHRIGCRKAVFQTFRAHHPLPYRGVSLVWDRPHSCPVEQDRISHSCVPSFHRPNSATRHMFLGDELSRQPHVFGCVDPEGVVCLTLFTR